MRLERGEYTVNTPQRTRRRKITVKGGIEEISGSLHELATLLFGYIRTTQAQLIQPLSLSADVADCRRRNWFATRIRASFWRKKNNGPLYTRRFQKLRGHATMTKQNHYRYRASSLTVTWTYGCRSCMVAAKKELPLPAPPITSTSRRGHTHRARFTKL